MSSEIETWSISLEIARRDLLDLWRAKMLLFAFLLMPILLMSMFGYMFPPTLKANPLAGNIPTAYPNLPIVMVVQDAGQMANDVSAQFKQIAHSQKLFTVSESPSYEAARNQLIGGQLSGIVVIPNGFSSAMKAGKQAVVQVTLDETNPQIAAVVQGEISTIFGIISNQIASQNVQKIIGNGVDTNFILEPISISGVPLITGTSSTFEFLAPGFMALTVVFGALSGVGFAISREREQGTMDGLLVSPIARRAVIMGKIMSQTVRGLIQGFLILGLSMILFGVRIYGSPVIMLLVMLLGVASFVGVGIILTAIAPEQETAQMMVMLLQFPMMFLSGILFPLSQLPNWMQWIGKALPLYYATDALRKVMILNAGLGLILPDIATLVLYSLLTMTAAIPLFEKAMTR
jgi:ABC-2 type transport system permease protein